MRTGSPWLLAGLAAVVVVTIAIIAYVAGVIPSSQQPPAPTVPLVGEGGGKETVGAIAAVRSTPIQTPTGIPTSGVTSTPMPSNTPTPEPPTHTPPPAKVLFTDNGATVTEPVSMELVRVPAGEFLMGSDSAKDSLAADDEKPQHPVTLTEFYIGKHEVTNAQYAAFVKATGATPPSDWENGNIPAGKEDHPVVYVTWDDAVAFTQWLSRETDMGILCTEAELVDPSHSPGWRCRETGMGFRLCTEAEWEKACRGESGLIYPWGDAFDANKANTAVSVGIGTTTPVGRYSPFGDSPYGVSDMAGNVWEWVADRYGGDYYASSPTENPQGSESGDLRVLRGGAFYALYGGRDSVRCAARYRHAPFNLFRSFGFRVCASP